MPGLSDMNGITVNYKVVKIQKYASAASNFCRGEQCGKNIPECSVNLNVNI